MKTEGLEITHDAFSRNTRNQLKRPIGFITPEDKPSEQSSSKAKAASKKA